MELFRATRKRDMCLLFKIAVLEVEAVLLVEVILKLVWGVGQILDRKLQA